MSYNDLLGIPRGAIKAIRVGGSARDGSHTAGTTATTVRTFKTLHFCVGNLVWVQDDVGGDSIVVPEDGLYFTSVTDRASVQISPMAVTINSHALTSNPNSSNFPASQMMCYTEAPGNNLVGVMSGIAFLRAGDVLRYQLFAASGMSTDNFQITWTVARIA